MAFSKSSLYKYLFITMNFLGHLCLLGSICLFINIAKQNPKMNLSDPPPVPTWTQHWVLLTLRRSRNCFASQQSVALPHMPSIRPRPSSM